MSEERLQKILARAGVTSRRKAEELIREGRVTVNGRLAELGEKADPERDAVKLDGKRIHPQAEHRYLLLNKPRGVMSTVADPEGRPTVMDLVPPAMRKALVPVGRLDFMTEGLLLLTDDGEFAQRVAHPRYGCVKTYEAKVRGRPEEAELDRLRSGIVLEGRRTTPCRIEPRRVRTRASGDSENSWWVVELAEGRTRQIREMFQRIGHPVQKLRRVGIGPVSDPELPLGALRELTDREVELLRRPGGKGLGAAERRKREGERREEKLPAKREAKKEARKAAGKDKERRLPGKEKPAARGKAGKPARAGGKGPSAPRSGRASSTREGSPPRASRPSARKPGKRSPAGGPGPRRPAGAKRGR
jgi:23S rRNA pseudouridine2605 synthase